MSAEQDAYGSSGDVLEVLRTPDDHVRDIVELAARLCDSEVAGVTIRHGDEFHIPVAFGLDPVVCAPEETICHYTMNTDGIFCIEDVQNDPRLAHIVRANGAPSRTRFYSSAPVHSPDGVMVGRLCVIDSRVKSLTQLQCRSLETMARSLSKLIELRLVHAGRIPVATPRNEPHSGAHSQLEQDRSELAPAEQLQPEQAAATVVSQLAAELSHDLLIPLSVLVAAVEMLREEIGENATPAVDALIDRAARASDRMSRMLDHNMDLKAVVGAPDLCRVDLAAVVRQVVLDSAMLLEAVDARVEHTGMPVVEADPDSIYSVFANLISNAVKYARPGTPARVRITAARVTAGWRISVRDNGMGIPEDRRVDVFSLFSRASSEVSGHGIGLATVARIINAHGGHVGAEGVSGGGTEIWFELPDVVGR